MYALDSPLALCLGLRDILSPDIATLDQYPRLYLCTLTASDSHSVPPDEYSMRIGPVPDCAFKCISQVLFLGSVLNDRDPQSIEVAKISLLVLSLPIAFRDALDLLEVFNLENVAVEVGLSFA